MDPQAHLASPATLLLRVAAGDPAATRECIAQFGGLVWSIAKRFDPGETEDAVQEIFLDLWRSAGRYDPQVASEAAFVAMIARRRLVDRVRRKTSRPAAASLEDPGVVPARVEPDDTMLRDEAAKARAAMQQLRPEQREVLELALGHGRSHQEIAATVGIPLGTVKSHARRGLLRLRKMLGVDPESPGGAT